MAYVAHRQAERVANGTINRELGVLIKMLRLAYEHRKLLRLPVIRKLKEAAPRQGFFDAKRLRLPIHLTPPQREYLALRQGVGDITAHWRSGDR